MAYVSVTYGAGGSTRNLTHDLVVRIQEETDLPVVSHLTCMGSTRDEIKSILDTYSDSGIENILALRGDPPQGQGPFEPVEGGFRYAYELVEFIRKHHNKRGWISDMRQPLFSGTTGTVKIYLMSLLAVG